MNAASPKLLVVDDEQVVCESCARIFQEIGFQVEQSCDAEQGLGRALAGQYQAILLDIRLPGMDGLEFLHRLRAANRDVPVIIITGYSSVASASAAMRAGATDYIPKPFSPDEIVEAVTRLVQTAPAPRPPTAPSLAAEWSPASDSILFGGEGWVQRGQDGTVRAGALFSRLQILQASRLRLPAVGEVVYRGLPLVGLELPDGSLETRASPISGRVVEINPLLEGSRALLHEDPCGGGWIARLAPTNLADELKRCAPRTLVLAGHDELLGRRELLPLGVSVRQARSAEEAIRLMGETGSDILLVDAASLAEQGPRLVGAVKASRPESRVVVLAGTGQQTETAYRRQGIYYYAVEPFSDGEIVELLQVLFAQPPMAAPGRPPALGLPRWMRKISVINRRGERTCLLASRGALQEQHGLGAHLLEALRQAAVPVQVTLGHGSVSAVEVQQQAAQVQRLLVLCVDERGSLPGSLARRTDEEVASLAGEYRHRVVVYSVQPGRRGGDSLKLDPATARALAEHILADLL